MVFAIDFKLFRLGWDGERARRPGGRNHHEPRAALHVGAHGWILLSYANIETDVPCADFLLACSAAPQKLPSAHSNSVARPEPSDQGQM